MFTRHGWLSLSLAAGLLAFAGCKHCDKPCNTCGTRPPAGAVYGNAPGQPAPGQIVPAPPPGALTAPPPGAVTSPPLGSRSFYAVPQGAVLAEPSWGAPANGQTGPPPEAPKDTSAKPEVKGESSTNSSALPVGIPQFAVAKSKVSSGLKPDPDGIVWLAEKGYRAVLYVRRTGDDDTAHRKMIESRGLKYLAMEVSTDTLTQETVEKFNSHVTEADNLPLYVYDKDGMSAGGLWYLHFRTVEVLSEDESRVKAARLGLKADPEGEHKAMWQAIQRYSTGKSKDE